MSWINEEERLDLIRDKLSPWKLKDDWNYGIKKVLFQRALVISIVILNGIILELIITRLKDPEGRPRFLN